MICSADPSIERAKRLIQSLYESKLLCFAEADQAKQEYSNYSVLISGKKKIFLFDKYKDRVDSFMGCLMQGFYVDHVNMWNFYRISLYCLLVKQMLRGGCGLTSMVNCWLKT